MYLIGTAYPVGRQDRHFYFFLLSLSRVRKARNATIKLPKVANSVSIPMKIDIISNAVIVTHLPSYVFPDINPGQLDWETATLSWVLFQWPSPRP